MAGNFIITCYCLTLITKQLCAAVVAMATAGHIHNTFI